MNEYSDLDWRLKSLSVDDFPPAAPPARRKTDADRQRALLALRDLVDSSLHLALRDKSRCQDDAFLRRFLYARKHDASEAFRLLVDYHALRRARPELWAAADGAVLRALADGLPAFLAQRDRRGRAVLVMFAGSWCPTACPLLAVYRALVLTLERALDDIQNQANGFTMVVDWSEFTFRQSCSLQPRLLKLMIDGLQDCLPVRFKSVHFLGQPWYVDTALAVVKPYLRAKTRERIVVHGSNLSTLHEALPRDILPAELGGEAPEYNPERWMREVGGAACAAEAGRRAPPAQPPDPAPARLDRGYRLADARLVRPGTGAGCELLRDND